MENKWMRFLSLMLALVMVIALMPVGKVDAVAAANTPVSHEGPLKSGQYLLVSANYLYRAGTPNMPNDAQTPTYRAVQAVARANDQKLTCYNFGDTLENITDYVWTLEIVSGNNVDGYTAKIKSADGKCMTFDNDNDKVTLVDDASVTILPGNDDCNKGESNTNGYKADDFIYTWGIKFDITDTNNRVYLNYGNPVGKWSFDNGSHWCFFPIQADAADAYRDIPLDKLNATVGDAEDSSSNEGGANLAVDNDPSTMWHTEWDGTSRDKHWFQFELKDLDEKNVYMIDGLRYQPRQAGNNNGNITKYEVQVSYDGVYYKTVASGEWANNRDWKIAKFEPQNAKYIRLVTLDSISDKNNEAFSAAAEIRVTGVPAYCEHCFEKEVIPATADAAASVRYTCTNANCDFVDTLELTANAKLNDNEIIALDDCEYTLIGDSNAVDRSLVSNGFYYVKPGSNGATIPQSSNQYTTLNLVEGTNGAVRINAGDDAHENYDGGLHLSTDLKNPYWNKCTDYDRHVADHDLYLFKADENSNHSDIPGYTKVSIDEISADESYLIAGKVGINWYIMVPSTSTEKLDHIAKVVPQAVTHPHTVGVPMYGKVENGYTVTVSCSDCGMVMSRNNVDKFGISYTNVSLDNDLKVHFAFEQALVDGLTGCYAVIEKGDETKTIPMDAWTDTNIEGTDYYYVTFDGVAAKEMTDEFTVTIYNAEKQPISTVYTDSVKGYAHRVLNGDYSAEYKTVMVDMLNYGAEAQLAFDYKEGSLANANLTDDEKALGTTEINDIENVLLKPEGIDYLANVKLESNIQFLMAFTGINPDTMTATVTFTDWNDVEHTVTPAFTERGRFHYITIEETVIADGRLPIICTIENGDADIVVIDSIASYAARAAVEDAENVDLYEAMMKFSDSSFAYLKSAQAN